MCALLDDAPLPDGVPVIVPAARFLADAEEFCDATRRPACCGRTIGGSSELAPYLDRLALIVLNSRPSRTAAAYSQARLLRERYRFRGELRATGQILRDQFLFLVRAGFDALEVVEDSRCRGVCGNAGALQRVLSAAGRPRFGGAPPTCRDGRCQRRGEGVH